MSVLVWCMSRDTGKGMAWGRGLIVTNVIAVGTRHVARIGERRNVLMMYTGHNCYVNVVLAAAPTCSREWSGPVAQWLGRVTCDLKVSCSTASRSTAG